MRNPNTVCDICSSSFYKRKSFKLKTKGNYCSQKCYGISCRKIIYCTQCKTEILSSLNKKTCSKKCYIDSLKDINRNHCKGRKPISKSYKSRNFRKKFIELNNKCKLCSYSLIKVLQIHHIVEKAKGGTDDISNLVVLCRNCHAEVHLGYRNLDKSLEN